MPHLHDKIDLTVSVFIVFNNQVLLRKHEKYDKWLAVGGHVELDEDPNQAAIREVKEEVGLDVQLYNDKDFDHQSEDYQELIAPQFINRHRVSPTHEHVDMVYFAIAVSDKTEETAEKSQGLKWFSKDELSDPQYGVSQAMIAYAQAALTKLYKK